MKKYMLKTSMLSVAVAVALGTVGCSSGSSSSSSGGDPVTSTTTLATAIDGILVDSLVCIDVNANNACDPDEDSTRTDVEGKFELTSTQTGALLLLGGTDIGTGLPFTGSLKAPAGSEVITPLTSAVQALVESGSSAVDAEATVQTALGITADIDLLTFDPLAAIEDGATAAAAKEVLAKQALLQTIVHAASATIAGADTDTDIADAMDNVFAQIVGNLDDLSAENVAAATKAAAAEVYSAPEQLAAQVAAVATAEDAAQTAVAVAEATETLIANSGDVVADFNAAILGANTTLQDDVAAAAEAAAILAAALDAAELEAIAAAQAEAVRVAAEILAAEQAAAEAAQAAADAVIAQAAAEAAIAQAIIDADTAAQAAAEAEALAAYNAQLAALVAEEEAAAAIAAAEIEAANAALLEAALAADAAAAAAAAQAEIDAATAAAELAALELQAAEEAAAAAALAADLQAAQDAAAAIELAAALDIAEAQAALYASNALNSANQAQADYSAVLAISNSYSVATQLTAAQDAATAASGFASAADTSAAAVAADTDVTTAQAELILTESYAADTASSAAGAATALAEAQVIVIATDIATAQAAEEAVAAAEAARVTAAILASQEAAAASVAAADLNASLALSDANLARAAANTAALITYADAQTAVLAADAAADDAHDSAIAAGAAVDAAEAAETLALATDVTELGAAAAAADAAEAATDAGTARAATATALAAATDALIEAQAIVDLNIAAAIAANQTAATDAANAAAISLAAANTSAIAAQAAADDAADEAISNIYAQAAADNAQLAANKAQSAASSAVTYAGVAEGAKLDALVTGVTLAESADAAALAIKAAGTTASFATIATDEKLAAEAALAAALSAEAPVAGADTTWYDGKTLHGFWIDNYDGLEVMYEDILLNSGTIFSSEWAYNVDSSNWDLKTSTDDDMTLNTSTGAWELSAVESYIINVSDNTIMTLNGVEDIRIDSVTDLGGQTVDFESEDGSVVIPVTFSAGALKYNISWKNLVDSYELEWTPEDWNNNNMPYSNLEDYMNTNGHFYWDEATGTSVQTQKDSNGAIDSNAFPIGTLTLGETGPLVAITQDGTTTLAGSWTVINLPGQTGVLTIDTELNTGIPNYDSYMRWGKALATTYDGDVRMLEFSTAMTAFVAEDEDAMGNDQAIADIKAAVEAFEFPTTIDVQAYFESGTKYFINEVGRIGERALSGGSYTGVYNTDAGDVNVTGSYYVNNNVLTLSRESSTNEAIIAANANIEITYAEPTEFGNGEMFSVSVNGEPAIETYIYDSWSDRGDGMVAATASMKAFFVNSTKYYLSDSGKIGFRTYSVDDGEALPPYRGTYSGDVEDVGPVNGTYEIMGDTMVLARDTGVTTVFKQTSVSASGLSQVFDVTLYLPSSTSTFVSTNYANEVDRDAAAAATTWSAELGSITEAEFTAFGNIVNPLGTWWFVDDASNFEEITIAGSSTTGTVNFTDTEGDLVVDTGLIYYTVDTVAPYGSVVGLKANEADTTYMEYIKFFESLDTATLRTDYPHITWTDGAAAVKNAGISAGESFEPWWDANGWGTVVYANFSDMITGMTYDGTIPPTDETSIIGNTIGENLQFASGTLSSDTEGDVVVESNDRPPLVVGSFIIRDVDNGDGTPVPTLVVTIDDESFNDHIAFQITANNEITRGEIYDRWSDVLLNTIAKDDVLNFLAP